ncbi:MAG: helix-turn-helix transcriptional regulator [Acidimicrobiales bacterium]
MAVTSTLVRQARSVRGYTQRIVAERSQIAQPTIAAIESGRRDTTVATFIRLIEAAGCQVALLPTRTPSVASVAASIHEDLRHGHEPVAFRRFIQLADDLRITDAALSVALAVQPPSPTGSTLYDALIAGVVEHRLTDRSLPLPTWVHEASRSLPQLTPLVDEPWYRDLAEATSPTAFRKHAVLISAGELESA